MTQLTGPSHVIDGIYICQARMAYEHGRFRKEGLTHVLKLYPDTPFWPGDFVVCDNALEDGVFIPQEALQRGVSFIQECVTAGDKVLVCCGAGVSRSSTFVLAYLLTKGCSLAEAWKILKTHHPIAAPLPAMWQSLITHYHLPDDPEETAMWPWQ